jgi:RNA 2',3'-cyclic 3'-phosphodiesterase
VSRIVSIPIPHHRAATSDPKTERLFLGVPVTDAARRSIAGSLPDELPGKPVIPVNWHFTVRFLGATETARRDCLVSQLSAASLGPPFAIRFGELGAFPNARRARILWLGLAKGEDRFRELGAIVEQIVTAVGFPPEKRPFTPHLTLSRIDPAQSVAPLLSSGAVGAEREASDVRAEMRVEALVLYRSFTGGGPPRYEEIEVFPLTS